MNASSWPSLLEQQPINLTHLRWETAVIWWQCQTHSELSQLGCLTTGVKRWRETTINAGLTHVHCYLCMHAHLHIDQEWMNELILIEVIRNIIKTVQHKLQFAHCILHIYKSQVNDNLHPGWSVQGCCCYGRQQKSKWSLAHLERWQSAWELDGPAQDRGVEDGVKCSGAGEVQVSQLASWCAHSLCRIGAL